MVIFNRAETFYSGSTPQFGSAVPSHDYRHMAIGFVASNSAKGTIELDNSGSLQFEDFAANTPTYCRIKSINITNGGHVHIFYNDHNY